MIDAIVLGAGQAGLATSYHLKQLGVEHVVLEKDRPGSTWLTQRWDSFMLNTINRLTQLPGLPFAPEDTEGFESATFLADYLQRFVEEHQLPLRSGVEVATVIQDDNGHFEVELSGGERLSAKSVVVATGSQNVPMVPGAADSLPPGITSLTSATYKNPGSVPAGAALVVGSGQSGVQIAEDLVDSDREVFLSTSKVGRLPRFYRGRDVLHWFDLTDFWNDRPADLADPAEMKAKQPQVSGTDGGHTVSLQSLRKKGVQLLGRLDSFDGKTARFQDNLRENVEFADTVSQRLTTRLDGLITAQGHDLPEMVPDPADEVDHDLLAYQAPKELDLAERGISTVIWSTGFTGDFSYLDVPGALDSQGQPEHVDGVSNVPGLYFMGMIWLRTRSSGVVYGVNADAEAVSKELVARL